MKVINIYKEKEPLVRGLSILGFSDGHEEVHSVYYKNQIVTFHRVRTYGPGNTITDKWVLESTQANYIQCDEWDDIINNPSCIATTTITFK